MPKQIWKYSLSSKDTQKVTMKKHAKILYVASQGNNPCIWALVDTENEEVQRTFVTHGTGHEIENLKDKEYIGSFQLYEGRYIFHIFELVTP